MTNDTQNPTTDTSPSLPIELLDFWAVWCGPCKIMEPIMDEIEKEYANKVTIRKINVDEEEHQQLVQQYNIMSIPTYILKNKGEVVDHFVGAQSKPTITNKIDGLLKS